MIDGYTSALKVKLRAVAIKWKFSELPFDRIIIELYIMIRLLKYSKQLGCRIGSQSFFTFNRSNGKVRTDVLSD